MIVVYLLKLGKDIIIVSMWILLVVVTIFAATYIAYRFYYQPRNACKAYVKQLKQLGYRVYELPFQIFKASVYESYNKYSQQKGDALYGNKYLYNNYDVIVTNLALYPHLIFLNLNLGKELLSPDKVNTLPKIDIGMKLIKHVAGDGLVMIEGEKWKARRKIISKAFTFEFLKELIPLISKVCNQSFDRLGLGEQGAPRINAELFKLGSKIFSSVVIVGFLGMETLNENFGEHEIQDSIVQALEESSIISRDPWILMFGLLAYKLGLKKSYRDLEEKLQQIRAFLKKRVTAFRHEFSQKSQEAQKNAKNLVELLLYYSKKEGIELTDGDLIDELVTFVAAGADTTASSFSMMIFHIFQHPEVEQRLRKQIATIFKHQEDFTSENLKKIEYLDWVQMESMRMSGPSEMLFERLPTSDLLIGDVMVKKGTSLNMMIRPTQYNKQVVPQPEQFNPERWQKASAELSNINSLHFGGGPRSCIGKSLALLELKIATIKFLQRFKDLKEINPRQFVFTVMYHVKSTAASFSKIQ